MYWSNFLHFYQPPTQKEVWVKRIAREAYRPILSGLMERPRIKLTLNVNGILLELFERYGEADIIGALKKLLARGQIELTGSAKYHPLLPFLSEDEAIRQIKLNEDTLRKYFGEFWQPRGFFPPEMGFNLDVAKIVARMGYQWVIADELSFPSQHGMIDYSRIYTVSGLDDFCVYFRERRASWLILSGQTGTGALLLNSVGERVKRNEYLLTAMDGETFGHHRPGLEALLFEMHDLPDLVPVLISDLPEIFPMREAIEPEPSTWALMAKDLESKKPFSRWRDPDNEIHILQWEMTELATSAILKANTSNESFGRARLALDAALHSDQYWWASAKPWWSIEMIERGAKELLTAVQLMPGIDDGIKNRALELYTKIIFTAFEWQRTGKVDELARSEDEDVRQRTDIGLPELPKREIKKMVSRLRGELKGVVKLEEFERAAQLRDRIRELKSYEKVSPHTKFIKEGDQEY